MSWNLRWDGSTTQQKNLEHALRSILYLSVSSLLLAGPAIAQELHRCGKIASTAGSTCKQLKVQFDLKDCDQEAQAPVTAVITCEGKQATATYRSSKFNYRASYELSEGGWGAAEWKLKGTLWQTARKISAKNAEHSGKQPEREKERAIATTSTAIVALPATSAADAAPAPVRKDPAAVAISIDARMDHVDYTPSDAVGKAAFSAFQISRLKTDFRGQLGMANNFRVRLDPTKSMQTGSLRDKVSPFIDFAYINHSFFDFLSASAGKIITGMGGIEGSINPGDVYLRSTTGSEIAGVYWPVGAQVDAIYGLHRVRLNLANNTEDVLDASGNVANTRNLTGATYTSSLVEGAIQPNASYHWETLSSSKGVDKDIYYFALGSRFVLGKFELEADFLQDSRRNGPQAKGDVLSNTSYIGLARYKIPYIGSVHVKYESTFQDVASSASLSSVSNIRGWTAAVEYKPEAVENWRLHVAYTDLNIALGAGTVKDERTVYIGMRIIADVLSR